MTKKMKIVCFKQLVAISALLLLPLLFCGCGYSDKLPSCLVETESPNVFRMHVIQPWGFLPIDRERVKAVMIYEPGDTGISLSKVKVYWKIVAEKSIDAEKFEVKAGLVPTGFVQEIPLSGETFVPISGKKYGIAVMIDQIKISQEGAPPWNTTLWVAQ